MTITVRQLVATDRGAWMPLWQEYLAFYKTDLAPEITDVTWTRFLDPAEGSIALSQKTMSAR